MANKYFKAKGRSCQTFIMLRHDMMDSLAWKSLHPIAISIWLLIARRYNGYNNGDIPLSCREVASALHVSKDTAAKHFKELIDTGFIFVTENSGFNRKQRVSRRFALTHAPIGNNLPLNNWKNFTVRDEGQTVR